MRSQINVRDSARCQVVPAATRPTDQLNLRGVFRVEHRRGGKLLATYNIRNAITIEGKNKLLDVMFHGTAALATWYIGLVDGGGSPTPVEGDTYEEIGGTNSWAEFTTYDEATRGEWTEGAAAAKAITNASPVVFNISASGTVYGLFLAGGATAATKSDATAGNTLWSVAAFTGGTVTVADGDQLNVTYTVQA